MKSGCGLGGGGAVFLVVKQIGEARWHIGMSLASGSVGPGSNLDKD